MLYDLKESLNLTIRNERYVRYSIFVLLLFFFPYLEPQVFKQAEFGEIDRAFAFLKILSASIIIILYFCYEARCSALFTTVVLLQTWILVSTLINGGSIARFCGPAIASIVSIMLVDIVSRKGRKYFVTFIRGLRDVLSVFFVLNCLSFIEPIQHILHWSASFLGIENRWLFFYLPWIFVTFLTAIFDKGKVTSFCWLVWGVSFIQLLAVWSVGAMLALLMWPILWALLGSSKKGKGLNKKSFYLLIFVILVLNILLVSGLLIDAISFVFVDVLDKDITLSGRTLLWSYSLDVINANPFFGNGVQSFDHDISIFGVISGHNVNHPHNFFLNIAYHGGYIAGFIFLFMFLIVAKNSSHNNNEKASLCNYCFMACMLIASLVDTLDFSLFYVGLAIANKTSLLSDDAKSSLDGPKIPQACTKDLDRTTGC